MKKDAFHFPGISIIVPKQLAYEGDIIAINRGIPRPGDIPRKTDKFTLVRLIANVCLYDVKDIQLSYPIEAFNPPIEIKVGYNFTDTSECKNDPKRLKLAYWDGNDWIIISDAKHEYQILPPSTAQIAEVKIKKWAGDPPIGWGR